MRYAATMRRVVGLAGLGLAAVAAASSTVAGAAPWTVVVEGGAEADTNVQRVETGPELRTSPVEAGVLRFGAKLARRAAAADGAVGFVLSALGRFVPSGEASTENVALFVGELRYLRPLAGRPVSLGFGLTGADAQPITDDVGARTFTNLGAEALLTLRDADTTHLTVGAGVRSFTYKENHALDWMGPILTARLERTLWLGAGGARSVELATHLALEDRRYEAEALVDTCPPDAAASPSCSAATSRPRRDRVQRLGAEVTWTGRIVAAAGYQLVVIDSNSYGASLVRHRATLSATRALPLGLYGTALAILQIDQYLDGLVLETDPQRTEITSLDDENRSSLQLRLARPVSVAWSVEARGALWRDLGDTMDLSYRRASLYAGLVYAR